MDIAITNKIKSHLNRLSQRVSDHPLITSIILCFAFFVLAIAFCEQKYETNDDYGIDMILSGVLTGEYDYHMLFSNILLGYMLRTIYSLIPHISFYFVLLEVLGLVSLIVIVWLILKRCRTSIGILVAVVLLVCFSDDIFILVQFTKIASVTLAAGGFLFLEGIYDKTLGRNRIAIIIFGGILFLLGSMLRLTCVYGVLPFLFIRFIEGAYKERFKTVIVNLLLCLGLICSAFALLVANNALWDMEPEYKSFRELNSYRASITDVPKPSYNEIQSELEGIGISEMDYYMATTWGFTDLSVFTPEKLDRLGSVLQKYNTPRVSSIGHAFEILGERGYWNYPAFLGVLLLSIVVFINNKKSVLKIVFPVITCFLLLLVFAFMGRVVYRAEYGIFFSAFVTIGLALEKDYRKLAIRPGFYFAFVFSILVAVILYHVGVYIPDTRFKTMDEEAYRKFVNDSFASPGYHLVLYNAALLERPIHEELIMTIEKDEHFYMIDPESMVNIQLNYSPWLRPEKRSDGGKNSRFIGSCLMMQYPGETSLYEQYGIDSIDPYKSLINDNVYVVDNNYYGLKLYYIREHYYPDAQIMLVGEKSGCKIWKFYLPQADNE